MSYTNEEEDARETCRNTESFRVIIYLPLRWVTAAQISGIVDDY